MRTFISVLFVVGSFALATSGSEANDYKYADADVVQKQTLIYELLQHVYQPAESIYKAEYKTKASSFNFEQSYNSFYNVDAVKEFYYYYKKGLMPYNEQFSIYNQYHLKQAIALFHVFYYAKDFETFYKAALWARYYVNPGLFVYALNVAVIHRKDFAGYSMPAIYEIFPQYFFNYDVIQRAQTYKQRGFYGYDKVDGAYNVILKANYSSYDVYSYEDQMISYFTEDIGLNAYYYYFNLDYPYWMGGEEYGLKKDRRGEYYMHFHQQLLARYYLERLSHDMGHIKEFTWWTPVQKYYPNIRNYYGYPFISRDAGHVAYQEYNHYDVDFIASYEKRFLDGIDSGYFLLENGTYYNFSYPGGYEYLGNLIQGNPDSLNYKYYNYMYYVYKTYGRYFGKYYKYQSTVYPSVWQMPETQLRDPAFWSFLKRVFAFYYKYTEQMYPYSYKELSYDGVRIESVDTDKLITYFEKYESDISNAVDVAYYQNANGRLSLYNGEEFVIKASQYRLNHVPFKVNINVASSVAAPSVVRIYLGPKYDEAGREIPLNENRFNYVLMDKFKYDLKSGNNLITRYSNQFYMQVKDRTPYYELYKKLLLAAAGKEQYKMDNSEAHSGFPARLLLPMGKKGGQVYRLFVYVSPYYAPQVPQYSTYDRYLSTGIGSGSRYIDSLPFYYPFDRPIDAYQWYTPNMYYYDVSIYHKTE